VATVAIALGGGLLFDVVNPGILARSAIGTSLAAVERTPVSQAVIFARDERDPEWSTRFARLVPPEPRVALPYAGPATLEALDRGGTLAIMLWSPGLEEEKNISAAVCGRWPGAALYTLYDQAHRSRAFGASPQGSDWQPALPASRWTVTGCDAAFETEGSRAAAALAAAEALFAQGRDSDAIDVLRQAALRSFVQVRLFETLAQAILERSPADREALYWATRATESKLSTARGFEILASAYSRQGRYDEAVNTAQRGEQFAHDREDDAAILQMRNMRSFYESERARVGR
jgi:tetratricopeptide (TPR) repeat protein